MVTIDEVPYECGLLAARNGQGGGGGDSPTRIVTTIKFWNRSSSSSSGPRSGGEGGDGGGGNGDPYDLISAMPYPHGRGGTVIALAVSEDGTRAETLSPDD